MFTALDVLLLSAFGRLPGQGEDSFRLNEAHALSWYLFSNFFSIHSSLAAVSGLKSTL
jgi:hypothetical protein